MRRQVYFFVYFRVCMCVCAVKGVCMQRLCVCIFVCMCSCMYVCVCAGAKLGHSCEQHVCHFIACTQTYT